MRAIRHALIGVIVVLYLLFEELIWETLVDPLVRALRRFALYRRFLDYIHERASPRVVLVLFVIPFVMGEGASLLSALLLAQWHVILAVMVYMLKIPLVIVALGIFQQGREKLLDHYRWFAWLYWRLLSGLSWIKATPMYHFAMGIFQKIKRVWSHERRSWRFVRILRQVLTLRKKG